MDQKHQIYGMSLAICTVYWIYGDSSGKNVYFELNISSILIIMDYSSSL